jgi:predicted RNA-binding Zn-ribbon protein involved in translation (DUF1610 family)
MGLMALVKRALRRRTTPDAIHECARCGTTLPTKTAECPHCGDVEVFTTHLSSDYTPKDRDDDC